MTTSAYREICNAVSGISSHIRFVGVVAITGDLRAYYRRPDLEPLLNAKNTRNQFSHIATKTGMEALFDESLGEVEFVWEEREKVQIISFSIRKTRVWVSIDKNVVRSEMLRIIDSCLPITRQYQHLE